MKRAQGSANTMFRNKNEALNRIQTLMKAYPEDPAVLALYERARTTGKGTLREIIQERVQHADRILNQIVERARQYVPASDPSRRQQ